MLERMKQYAEQRPGTFQPIMDALNAVMAECGIQEDADDVAEVLLQRRYNRDIAIKTDDPILKSVIAIEKKFWRACEKIAPPTYFIFVYGTLKRGFPLEAHLEGERFVDTVVTQPNYRMYVALRNWFPMLAQVKDDGLPIEGELWEVSEETLRRLDRAEGRLFSRGFVELMPPHDKELVEAFVYKYMIFPEDLQKGRVFDCGTNWQGVTWEQGE